MKSKTLSYKSVFSVYEETLSYKLSQKTFSLYKAARISLSKLYPLNDTEKFQFEDYFTNNLSSEMPKGFDFESKEVVDGHIRLEYIDLFDYLPKEEMNDFKNRLMHFTKSNRRYKYSSPYTERESDYIEELGRYEDGIKFSKFHSIELLHNDYLHENAPVINIAIRNLSTSFVIVQYRLIISDSFNIALEKVFNAHYEPYTQVFKQIDTPWFKPNRFGKSYYNSDDARTKKLYYLITELKWKAYLEIKQYFQLHFPNEGIFPPVFETYSTNILFDKSKNIKNDILFLNSIGCDLNGDYSKEYRICVNWSEKISSMEGTRLLGFCEQKHSDTDYLPEIAMHEVADEYSVYLVANTMRFAAEQELEKYNKEISKIIRGTKTNKLLNLRSSVRRQLYYSRRFVNEFSGYTLDKSEIKSFANSLFRDGKSMTQICFDELPKTIADTKKSIDNLLYLLEDASEYELSRSNLKLQWFMLIITFVSLLVALVNIIDVNVNSIIDFLKGIGSCLLLLINK